VHLGIHVVQPPSSNPAAVLRASAHAAEALGYRSLWVGDRLIEGTDRRIGEGRPLDALATLAFLAAGTERIRLGTNVLAGAWYPPALLARSLASVDQLSRGRLTIGLSSSPSEIESAAAGIDDAGSDQRVDELLGALEVAWRSGQGPGPLPVQQPRPPILLTGRSDADLERVGRLADGWHAAPAPPDELEARWRRVREVAAEAGRDPRALAFVVRVHLDEDLDARVVADRVATLAGIGVDEVILEAGDGLGLDGALARFAAVAEAVEPQTIA
jgi:alkanesulfonate monooxygenase SsuD/methylene tetrahydromethanopterin reductase-like flavin-dependent oxidoreductase (luciferase family)